MWHWGISMIHKAQNIGGEYNGDILLYEPETNSREEGTSNKHTVPIPIQTANEKNNTLWIY
jgi:hypothetical protein